jgi:hypothetical protein
VNRKGIPSPKPTGDNFPRYLGVAALFSGAAVVTHIVAGFSLLLALVVTATILVVAVGLVWVRASPVQRVRVRTRAKLGLLYGILATGAYDFSKFALSQWDASPYNPFEAIRMFGLVLIGPSVPTRLIYAAGTAFHLLNGCSFGVAYCFLFGHRGMVAGIAWGFFLELFQLTLFPGWLDIRLYREFVQISTLSHVVYGAVMGLSCQRGLREPKA